MSKDSLTHEDIRRLADMLADEGARPAQYVLKWHGKTYIGSDRDELVRRAWEDTLKAREEAARREPQS